MGISERKQKYKKEVREKILKEALNLFINEGFEKVTMRRIAEKIEYNPATIYLYFKNKNSILFELHEEGFKKLYEKQKEIMSVKDPLMRLREHARIYVKFAVEMPYFYDLMFLMNAPLEEICSRNKWEAGSISYNFLRDNISDCLDSGYFKGAQKESLTLVLWSMVHGIAALIIKKRMDVLPAEFIEIAIEEGLDYIILKSKN